MSTFDEATPTAASSPGELGERLIALTEVLRRRVRPSYHSTRLTAARMSALRIIIENDGSTGGQIAQAEQVTQATITRVLDGLDQSGFIERTPSRHDRRIVDVRATDEGRNAFREAVASHIERLAGDLTTLDTNERSTVSDALRHLERVFQNS